MPVLMWKKDAKGRLVGRCAKRCYDSTKPVCHCVCEGLNHGAGLSEATERTAVHLHNLNGKDGLTLSARVKQYYFDWQEA